MKKRVVLGFAFMLALSAGVYFYANYDPSDYGFYPKCAIYTLTGYKCPGCGSQRALYDIIHGRFLSAFLHNPLMFAILPYVFFGIYLESIADLAKPRLRKLQGKLYNIHAFMILLAIMLIYAVARNICDFSPAR